MAKRGVRLLVAVCVLASISTHAQAQQTANSANTVVPRLIKFSGILLDGRGSAMKGPVGVTFALYTGQSGGAALWMETQNVEPDSNGNYTVLLGAASVKGVPQELFASGEARWLGIQVENQAEQPRVLLVSVPYALKAVDAETLGGLPPSAFAQARSSLAESSSAASSSSPLVPLVAASTPSSNNSADPNVTTAGGTVNFIPKFDTPSDVKTSQIFDNGTDVGIGFPVTPTPVPIAKLDVNGSANFRGTLQLPAIGTATSTTKGFNSRPFDYLASVFNGTAAVNQHFRWQAEPVNPGLSTASGKLNLLFASGTGTPAETGFSINNKGQITFASGQTFPTISGNETVTGNETVNGTVSGSQLISTVANGTAPLKVTSTTLVPNLNASLLGGMPASSFATRGANSFSGFQSIAGNGLSMYIGDVACPAGTVGIQAQLFSFGCLNFAMLLDSSGNTIINRPMNGVISFREGNGSDQMTITSTGQVGIGTTGPLAQLEVKTATGVAISATGGIDGSTGIGGIGGVSNEAGVDGGVGVVGAGGDSSGGAGGPGIQAVGGMDLTHHVMGLAGNFFNDIQVHGCVITPAGDLGAGCPSDVRFKKDIQAFPAVLDKVVQLQPVSYNWKTEEYPQYRFSSDKAIGLIAQDVEKLFPDMVSTDQAGYKRVNYGELPYLMLQAIRELKAENDDLRERIQRLEKAAPRP